MYKLCVIALLALGIVLQVSALMGCTPVQRDWKTNTSIDIGVGAQEADPGLVYGYLGASYWLDYGISVTAGAWKTVEPYWGPYVGINYSFTPLD